ncbi:MAG: hypothetical protein HY082_06370 [Gammaproteobacteria bacterium]|nr:hypothetical protein [Gammaproteobacteria bacterium]
MNWNSMVEEYKCAFNATLMGDQFGCAHARHVARRGGPDIACVDNTGHERCQRLFDLLKASALPTFGVEDDPLSMPHSTLVKIQFGGLLGIQRLLGDSSETVADINALVGHTESRFGGLETVPCEQTHTDMTGYKIRRRK